MNKEAFYLATLGVSLTAIMATAMFLLDAYHPKDATTYNNLPWVYAVVSATVGCSTQLTRYRMDRAMRLQPVRVESGTRR
jgi:hypothetical protein